MNLLLVFLVGFAGGVGAALTLAFGEAVWLRLVESRWLGRVTGPWREWRARRRHRRSGRV